MSGGCGVEWEFCGEMLGAPGMSGLLRMNADIKQMYGEPQRKMPLLGLHGVPGGRWWQVLAAIAMAKHTSSPLKALLVAVAGLPIGFYAVLGLFTSLLYDHPVRGTSFPRRLAPFATALFLWRAALRFVEDKGWRKHWSVTLEAPALFRVGGEEKEEDGVEDDFASDWEMVNEDVADTDDTPSERVSPCLTTGAAAYVRLSYSLLAPWFWWGVGASVGFSGVVAGGVSVESVFLYHGQEGLLNHVFAPMAGEWCAVVSGIFAGCQELVSRRDTQHREKQMVRLSTAIFAVAFLVGSGSLPLTLSTHALI